MTAKPHDPEWADALLAYAAGTADDDTREALERHLEHGCDACEKELVELVAVGVVAGAEVARAAPQERRSWVAPFLLAAGILVAVALLFQGLAPGPPGAPTYLEFEDGDYVAYDLKGREVWRWRSPAGKAVTRPLLLAISAETGFDSAYIPLESNGEWRLARVHEGQDDEEFERSLRSSELTGDALTLKPRQLFGIRWRSPGRKPNLLVVADQRPGWPRTTRSALLRIDATSGEVLARRNYDGALAPYVQQENESLLLELDDEDRLLILVGGFDHSSGKASAQLLNAGLKSLGGTLLLPPSGWGEERPYVKSVQANGTVAEIGTSDGVRIRIAYSRAGWGNTWQIGFIDELSETFASPERARQQFESRVEIR